MPIVFGNKRAMYFSDFSEYSYLKNHSFLFKEIACPLNIGWLDTEHFFETEKASEKFLDALFDICAHHVNQTMGFHQCPFVVRKFGD